MLKSNLQELFSQLLDPKPRMLKSMLLELILSSSGGKSQGQKMLKPNFLRAILLTSGTSARDIQIEHPGTHFVDFWSQDQKMLESGLLEPIVSTIELS